MDRLLKLLFCLIILFNLGSVISKNKEKYFTSDYSKRYQSLEYIYNNSQYVSKNPIGWVPDEVINAYAGGAYVKGVSPILIAPDTPPLGRYLIGISTILFNNENIIIPICGLISLVFMYLLGLQILRNKTLALLAVALLSFEPIFLNQFAFVPLLDIMQLAFLLPAFYFFNKGVSKDGRKQFLYFVLASIFLGAFVSTKFFITGITVVAAWYLTLVLRKNKKAIILLTASLPFSLLILLLSYIKAFADDPNLKRFLGIQKWVFLYHKSQLILPFSIWPLILLNKWYVWYGDKPILSDFQWRITWPVIFIGSLITIFLYFTKKISKKPEFEVLAIWTICYLLFFSFGQITSRYLIIYLPILYLITIFGLENFLLKRKHG